uniref:Uncharacterized protein n=1 Tax=Cacopsylla melanoneura TaxID=428564 RepID=A0A8D8QC42_9HEMI
MLPSFKDTTPVGFTSSPSCGLIAALSPEDSVGCTSTDTVSEDKILVVLSKTCAYRPSIYVPKTSVDKMVVIPSKTSVMAIVEIKPVGSNFCADSVLSIGKDISGVASTALCGSTFSVSEGVNTLVRVSSLLLTIVLLPK